ncbi:MAG: ribonuclease P protein component [Phycisphaerae bacterium]
MYARENFSFSHRRRLRRQSAFKRLLREGKRAGDQRLQVWARPNDLGYSRFGVIVGRKHGSAVRRNRIKRVLREAFRLSRAALPRGLDIACAPRVGGETELRETIESLRRVTARLARGFARD